jgi:hypothetical protein
MTRRPWDGKQRFLLVLTVVGFVTPNAMVIAFVAREGVDLGQYFGDWFGSLPASQITVDIFIVAAAFLTWSVWEARRVGIERTWVVWAATFGVGLCFGAPLFLLMRERALAQAQAI